MHYGKVAVARKVNVYFYGVASFYGQSERLHGIFAHRFRVQTSVRDSQIYKVFVQFLFNNVHNCSSVNSLEAAYMPLNYDIKVAARS